MNTSRRAWLQKALASGALLGGGVSGLVREALAAGSQPIASGIHRLQGDVRLNGRAAAVGDLVKKGDALTTGANGQAVLVIDRDAFMVRGNTQVTFDQDGLKRLLRIVSGGVLSVFAKGEHRIETSAATMGIRGTGGYVEVLDPARTYFCLCYGETTVENASGQRLSYRTGHHEAPHYLYRDAMPLPAPMRNHTDEELILLESLVGRYPPFYNSGYGGYGY